MEGGTSAVGAVSNRAYRNCLANVGRGPVPRQVHARPDDGEGQALALRVKRWKPAHEAEDESPAAVGRGLKPRLPDLPRERSAGACPPPGSRASGRWRGTGPRPTGEKMKTCSRSGERGPGCRRRGFKPRLPDLPRERSAGACPPPGSRASGRLRGTGPRPTGEKMETCSRSGGRGPICGRRGLKPRLPDLPRERRAGACPLPGSRASGRWRGTGPRPTGEKMETSSRSVRRGPSAVGAV